MTTLEERLRDPDYRNWVKSALCLQYTRDGLETFSGQKSLELNKNIIQQLRLNGNPSVYNLCPTIRFDLRRKLITCCRNCNDILTEVMKYRPWPLDLNLKNADPTKLLHQHWQCSKMFMNTGQDVNSSGPKETDISALLNFVDHCTVPRGFVNNPDLLKQVRDTRNRVLHTPSMKITDNDFQNVITPLLIDLLSDPGFLQTDPDANEAVEKIRDVKKADFIITTDNERKVLDTLTNEIRRLYNLTNDEMKKLNDGIDTLSKDVSSLESSNKADMNVLRDDIKKNDTEVSEIRRMQEALRKLVEQSKDMHDDVHQHLADIQEQTKSTADSHKALQIRVEIIQTQLIAMQKQIEETQQQTNNLSSEQIKLKATQTEDRQEIRQDISIIYQRQDYISKAFGEIQSKTEPYIPSEEDKLQLRKYLIDGYKDKLDVTLLPDWEPLHVSNIFTPAILICDREKQTQEKEKFRNLETYRELFYKNGVLQKRVILLGEAGAGKTTFIKHLTDVWSEKTRQTQFSDVDELKQFKYFFYVSCRFAEEKETLSEMINNQLIDDETMQAVAKYVLKNYPEHCLILLDGADEWKGSPSSETGRRGDIAGLPSMAGVEGCVILITSRPWRFHALSTKARGIFRLLKISGIKNVQELAYRILEQLDDPDPKQSSYEFLWQIREKNMDELMEIPLILIIALGGWVDDKSLHRSITVNYINMIQSFISRSKGQSGWSSSESKLRQLVPHLETLETVWGQKSNELPYLLSKYQSIRRYAGLFLSLGQLAFDLLLGKEEQSLVFSKQVFKSYLPADDENDESVKVCLALGILSKTETTTRGLRKLESYAFCHKTFQEFFAALWLASKYSNEKSKLYKGIKSYRDLMSYAILIIFLCGFDTEAGKRFWVFVSEEVEIVEEGVVKDVLDIERKLIERERKRKMKDVTDLVCKCMKEHGFDQKDQTSDQIYFCIPHMVIDITTSNEDIMLLCHVMDEYPCNVKSLYVDYCQSHLQTLCSGLQSLKLSHNPSVNENSDSLMSPVRVLQKHNRRKKRRLFYWLCCLSCASTKSDSEHSDSEYRHSFEYIPSVSEQRDSEHSDSEHSDSEHSDCNSHSLSSPVLDLQKHDKLETLYIQAIHIEGLLLPVEGARITSLRLLDITMSHHGCEQLSESLSSCSHLKYLYLYEVRCGEHSDSCCIPVLDLQKHDKLEILDLRSLSIEGLLLPVEGARITFLRLLHVTMSHHGCEQLSESLSSCSHLEYLYLEDVRCREHSDSEQSGSEHCDSSCVPVLDLQKHDKLKTLDLQWLSIEGLLLPVEGVRITSLTLYNVTMTHHGCEQLSAAFSSRPEQENWRPFEMLIYAYNEVICREHSDSSCQPVKDITNFIESHLK